MRIVLHLLMCRHFLCPKEGVIIANWSKYKSKSMATSGGWLLNYRFNKLLRSKASKWPFAKKPAVSFC
jgi:hypothetical protein